MDNSSFPSPGCPTFLPGLPLQRSQVFENTAPEESHNRALHRETGVVFSNLTVLGLEEDTEYHENLLSIFTPTSILREIQSIRHPPIKEILTDIEGLIRPGEMLLVLGRPDAGCTTLLKVLATLTAEFHSVKGKISYDGVDSKDMRSNFRGDIVFCSEDDIHFPSLNVEQTLHVSSICREAKNRTETSPQKRDDFYEDLVLNIADMLHIQNTLGTRIGNEQVKGVSGGEKRRVTIAEYLSTRPRLSCWDNITRGLDSSTALRVIQTLRQLTDASRITTIVSIYQISENIYNLFDKVMVLYEGRMIYHGSREKARDYFLQMGYQLVSAKQTTPDFICSVTDPSTRSYSGSSVALFTPRTPYEFSEYFSSSALGHINHDAVKTFLSSNYNNRGSYELSVKAEKSPWVWKRSPYLINVWTQARLLVRRRADILRGSWITLLNQAIVLVSMAVVLGIAFVNLETSSTSLSFSRESAIFMPISIIATLDITEVPSLFFQKSIVLKHFHSALYFPFIDSLATTIVDLPGSFLILLLFDIIFYFMSNLQRHSANFFIFVLVLYLSDLVMKSIYRSISAVLVDRSKAEAVSCIALVLSIIFMDYVVPSASIPRVFRWLTHANPLRYAYEALIINEFHHSTSNCSELIPYGPNYDNVSLLNQACSSVGGLPGSRTIDGDTYIFEKFGYKHSSLWRNVGILFVFWAFSAMFYSLMTQFRMQESKGDTTRRSNVRIKRRVNTEPSYYGTSSLSKPVRRSPGTISIGNVFSWHNITCDITTQEPKRLLDDVSGYVVSGKITALMGESGAGKTTLLNVLSQRLSNGIKATLSGKTLINGLPASKGLSQRTGYCQQLDVHMSTTTVREALQFSALLRRSDGASKSEKLAYVEEIIALSGMTEYADFLVGEVGRGLTAAQRKRLTIGVELAAMPELLLFIDEPTSGLSSEEAWSLVKLLKVLASRGLAILCTIHQPTEAIFQEFDNVILLGKGGKACYFGDIGPNAREVLDYFESNGARKCEPHENPAEYILETLSADATTTGNTKDWTAVWNRSNRKEKMQQEVQCLAKLRDRVQQTDDNIGKTKFASSQWIQFNTLMKRASQNYSRNSAYIITRTFTYILLGIIVGVTFHKLDQSFQGYQNSLFICYVYALLGMLHAYMLQIPFLYFRQIYELRERASNTYHWIPLIWSSILIEIPINVIGSTLYFVCLYWTVGWPNETSKVGYQYLMAVIISPIYFTTLGQLTTTIAPDAEIAALWLGSFCCISLIYSGIPQPYSHLRSAWHWMHRVVPNTYLIEALFINVSGGRVIKCSPRELVALVPPNGKTCGEYMHNFIQTHGGYLMNETSTTLCRLCPISNSNDFLARYDMNPDHRWRNVGILCGYIVFNVRFWLQLHST